MADLFKLNAYDKKKIDEGVWFPIQEDCEFLIRPTDNNEEYEKSLKEFQKKYRRKFRTGYISELAQYRIAAEAIMECNILLDWKNVEWHGKKLKFTKENALKILQDKEVGKIFVEAIVKCSKMKEDFLIDFEEDSKNLETSCSTS